MKDEGFSVAEVMAALIVLSLAALFLGESVSQMMAGWSRTGERLSRAGALSELLADIDAGERKLKQDAAPLGEGPVLKIDDGPPLELTAPRIDRGASCVFDLIGRRCR
ncbi:hypothetical protein HNE_2520 [Hyphomonas neptunium ATCC 15444]|uniref:Prepilin-type N-terminal cleavage/methylation domain-containing protein n=2 Tax=Hyphomonas TaxID=85 RepID=Q0BZ79_HYPNA|nr:MULTISPECIES: hypothetical protein [Hyphomonas]ABI76373.1 hypothetical protein HNE_2520 [Hyphomonas neptunium ATCC 15444]KCZ95303.1 hypothetical protein HHI_06519 [Hyphomonas hirschiana VP5]